MATQLNRYACPCCGFLTIESDEPPPGTYSICPVCFWEDDPVQFRDPSYCGGANDESLQECRDSFEAWAAAGYPPDPYRRRPTGDEVPH